MMIYNFFVSERRIPTIVSLCLLFGIASSGYAQTEDELKARFASLLGPNRYARLVWQEEACDGRKPNFDVQGWCGGTTKLMALDTRDGIVRQLVADSIGSHWSGASFTWDGNRVVYTDNSRKTIRIVNWDGTGKRILLRGYDGDGRCYQSSDGKHWALASEYKSGTGSRFIRVNVDDTTEKVTILTCSWTNVGWAGATCWASISRDGKYVAAGLPNYDNLGYVETATGKITKFTIQGCWPTIARDTTYHVLYTDNPGSHRTVKIIDINNKEISRITLNSSALGGADNYTESVRWTPDRDYITFWAYRSGFIGSGIPNPRLLRLSDQRWVAIRDNPTVAMGNMDVFFYTATASEKTAKQPLRPLLASIQAVENHRYDCRGRVLSAIQSKYQGVRLIFVKGEERYVIQANTH